MMPAMRSSCPSYWRRTCCRRSGFHRQTCVNCAHSSRTASDWCSSAPKPGTGCRACCTATTWCPLPGSCFAPSHRGWWAALALSPSETLRVQQDLALLDYVEHLVNEVEAELARLSATEPWVTQMPFVVQLPGFGGLTAITVLAAIGDITRFPSAKKFGGYSGLGAWIADSGDTHRSDKITKEGRRELRAVVIEAAWVAVEHHPHWQAQCARLAQRMGKPKAIVAIARRLLVAV